MLIGFCDQRILAGCGTDFSVSQKDQRADIGDNGGALVCATCQRRCSVCSQLRSPLSDINFRILRVTVICFYSISLALSFYFRLLLASEQLSNSYSVSLCPLNKSFHTSWLQSNACFRTMYAEGELHPETPCCEGLDATETAKLLETPKGSYGSLTRYAEPSLDGSVHCTLVPRHIEK